MYRQGHRQACRQLGRRCWTGKLVGKVEPIAHLAGTIAHPLLK